MADARAQAAYRHLLDDTVARFSAKPDVLLRDGGPGSGIPIIPADHRREDTHPLIGLELGTDDFLAPPLALYGLLERVHAVLRQLDAGLAAPPRDPERRLFRFCGWQLDCKARRLTDPAGATVTLTKGEYTLLVVFLNAPNRPLSREYLLQATHLHEDVSDRSIDVQVLRLRRKLERGPNASRVIQTERSVGYVFAVPVERL